MEDLDGPRVRPEASSLAIDLLTWLGIDWNGEMLVQSADSQPYRDAMRRLAEQGLVYRCELTRSQVAQAASAPHRGEHELRFPPELRPSDARAFRFDDERMNFRFLVPDESVSTHDEVAGDVVHRPCDEVGDFIVWTRRGSPAYQLAVVVDDARQGVTDVVRGDDLLPSAARQTLLYRALRLNPPRWWHLPLVVGPDGARLAKRHGDARLDTFRRMGVRAERVIGLLALWSGAAKTAREMTAEEFHESFSISNLPRHPTILTPEHLAWLVAGSRSSVSY
jgi:glutamyl-tRNA synthetase